MAKGLKPLSELLTTDKTYVIPPYQRQYSWGEAQLADLWNDLYYTEGNKRHFFGTILLKETEETVSTKYKTFKKVEIIDGQQRLTTVLILLGEVLSKLKEETKDKVLKDEIDDMISQYLRYKDVYKLNLLGDDDEYFRNNIVDGKEFPHDLLTPSRRRLLATKSYFAKRLKEARSTNHKFKEFLVKMKGRIDALEVIEYDVDDEEDAVLIFETVNDRGKPLSQLEKTKSFLMHQAYLCSSGDATAKLAKIGENFASIFRYIEEINSAQNGANFDEDGIQRYHFIVFESSAKDDYQDFLPFLKKKLRKMYRKKSTRSECLDYVMKYSEDLMGAFFAMKQIVHYETKDSLNDWLERFFALGRTANFMPVLLACWIKYEGEPKSILPILKRIESLAFRAYAIGNRRADTGIGQLYDLANAVYYNSMSAKEVQAVILNLIEEYADNERFESALTRDDFYDEIESRDTKYLLYFYERQLCTDEKEQLDIGLTDFLSKKWEVEHIWADNAIVATDQEKSHEKYKHQLGNLTVASKPWNGHWGKASFQKKRKEYSSSSLRIQRELARHKEWRKNQIINRTGKLEEYALERWPSTDSN